MHLVRLGICESNTRHQVYSAQKKKRKLHPGEAAQVPGGCSTRQNGSIWLLLPSSGVKSLILWSGNTWGSAPGNEPPHGWEGWGGF